MRMPCAACQGAGQMRAKCGSCSGSGLTKTKKKVTVTVPAGVDSTTNLRLVGQGDAGPNGGPKGHLWVKLKVRTALCIELSDRAIERVC